MAANGDGDADVNTDASYPTMALHGADRPYICLMCMTGVDGFGWDFRCILNCFCFAFQFLLLTANAAIHPVGRPVGRYCGPVGHNNKYAPATRSSFIVHRSTSVARRSSLRGWTCCLWRCLEFGVRALVCMYCGCTINQCGLCINCCTPPQPPHNSCSSATTTWRQGGHKCTDKWMCCEVRSLCFLD